MMLHTGLHLCPFRFNRIHRISDKSLADLRKLELLLIHGNDIHSLPDGVFRDLQSLQVHNKDRCLSELTSEIQGLCFCFLNLQKSA